MEADILLALVTLVGSVIGTFAGIIVNTRLVNYRLSQLEAKMDKHNRVIDRVYALEKRDAVVSEELKVVNHRIGDLEAYHK